MPRKRRSRIYLHNGRCWSDFRDSATQGGKREPLVAAGDRYATDGSALAEELASDRVADLQVWLANLARTKYAGRSLSNATIRHHLNALSHLYRRVISESYIKTVRP